VEDFYMRGFRMADGWPHLASGQEPADNSTDEARPATENIRVIDVPVSQHGAESRPTVFGPLLTAPMEPLMENLSFGVATAMEPSLIKTVDFNFVAAGLQAALASWSTELTKNLSLGIAAIMQPAFEQFNAQLFGISTYAQTARADLVAKMTALAETYSPHGVGVAAVPKPSLSGAGEIVLPGGTNAWPAVAEQFQRIGALPCGHIYALVLLLVLFALLPKLRDDVGDAGLFLTIANAIIRWNSGHRR
jgi:hypothetical protein